MTDPQIMIALISSAAVVLAALVTAIATIVSSRNERRNLRRQVEAVAADARAVRHQTQNTHETNLRDDVDMVLRIAARIEDSQYETRRDIGHTRSDVAQLRRDLGALRDHVTESDGDNEKVHRNIFERLASLTNPAKDTQQ